MPAVGPGLFHGHHVVTASNRCSNPAPRRIIRKEAAHFVDLVNLLRNHC